MSYSLFRFGIGYTLQVKIDINQDTAIDSAGATSSAVASPLFTNATANFHDFITTTFEHAMLIEEHQVRA